MSEKTIGDVYHLLYDGDDSLFPVPPNGWWWITSRDLVSGHYCVGLSCTRTRKAFPLDTTLSVLRLCLWEMVVYELRRHCDARNMLTQYGIQPLVPTREDSILGYTEKHCRPPGPTAAQRFDKVMGWLGGATLSHTTTTMRCRDEAPPPPPTAAPTLAHFCSRCAESLRYGTPLAEPCSVKSCRNYWVVIR